MVLWLPYLVPSPGGQQFKASDTRVRKMFILAEMQDIIRIEPWKFGLDMNHVITSILNKKFANKVMDNFSNLTVNVITILGST